mgnify:CR=1 FL=1
MAAAKARAGAISIHAAREGGDFAELSEEFYLSISIHAAREGGDAALRWGHETTTHFNPRRP